jgi:hypothetical protein
MSVMRGYSPRRPARRPVPDLKAQRRLIRVLGWVTAVLGVFFLLISLVVFLTQASEVRVTASVLSRNCSRQYDAGSRQTQTRCNALVRYNADGRTITTTITDAFPTEFTPTGHGMTIDLRYDPGYPADPYKQSDYMSAGVFAALLSAGALILAAGTWWVIRAEPLAAKGIERVQRRRHEQLLL